MLGLRVWLGWGFGALGLGGLGDLRLMAWGFGATV